MSMNAERLDRMQAAIHVGWACVFVLLTMGRATIPLVVMLAVCYVIWARRSEWPPASRIIGVYGAAVVVQCAHLLEEYRTGFYRVFPPVFGADPWSARRFLTFNVVWLIVFLIGGFGLVRGRRGAYLVAMFLALGGGVLNGLGHIALSIREGGYFPGAYTGVLALVVGTVLAHRVLGRPRILLSAGSRPARMESE
jgi:hypothetical protein